MNMPKKHKKILRKNKTDWDTVSEHVLFAGGFASIAFMLLVFLQIITGWL